MATTSRPSTTTAPAERSSARREALVVDRPVRVVEPDDRRDQEREEEPVAEVEVPALGAWEFGEEQAKAIRQPAVYILGGDSPPFFGEGAELLRSWIAAGVKYDPTAPRVTKLEMFPKSAVIQLPGQKQQLSVFAMSVWHHCCRSGLSVWQNSSPGFFSQVYV